MRHPRFIAPLLAVGIFHAPASAAEWTWTWVPAPGEGTPTVSAAPLKYGKTWAYAVEIDDGPKWVRSFAIPFLANYQFTDAPPGVAGGRSMPFVGSIAAIACYVGYNDAYVNEEDLKALEDAGWGVLNHSFDHRGFSWKEEGKLSDQEIAEDAYWSQHIFAAGLPGGRAPTGAVYANGYTDYNRNDALAKIGIGIATRVGGTSTRDVTSPTVRWLDFPRSYLDEPVWSGRDASDPMAQFPATAQNDPTANHLVIDFTHKMEQDPASANQQRWQQRLSTIAGRWGKDGSDALWCAPTADIADYVRASKAATWVIRPGKITVTIPDHLPGSAITLRLKGINAASALQAPTGGAVHRQGSTVVLTSPIIGERGAQLAPPKLYAAYDGPPKVIVFPRPIALAGVTVGLLGNPSVSKTYHVQALGRSGTVNLGERTLAPGKWLATSHLFPVLPSQPAQPVTQMTVEALPEIKRVVIWALEERGKPK